MAKAARQLTVSTDAAGAAVMLTVEGVLDTTTYRKLRDIVIKAALDVPEAILIDVDALDVPVPSAWCVFTSARWHVRTWPDIPIALISAHPARRATIAHHGVARYVPVHPNIEAALRAVAANDRPRRSRARASLPASPTTPRQGREFVAESLAAWSLAELIPVATVIVNVFIENVLQHTASTPTVVLETDGTIVTVAVQDGSDVPALRREDIGRGHHQVSGLAIVAAVSRAWGCLPTPSGKTVWAVVGPENRL
jgi:hypothetical protein